MLRPSSVGFADSKPPRGRLYQMFLLENKLRPSSAGFADSFPPGGSL